MLLLFSHSRRLLNESIANSAIRLAEVDYADN